MKRRKPKIPKTLTALKHHQNRVRKQWKKKIGIEAEEAMYKAFVMERTEDQVIYEDIYGKSKE